MKKYIYELEMSQQTKELFEELKKAIKEIDPEGDEDFMMAVILKQQLDKLNYCINLCEFNSHQ